MATVVTMPSLGESVLEGTVGKWLVREGDAVGREQMVVEILTDKTDSPVPSPVAGVVTKILVKEGDIVLVGGKLCEIEEGARAAVAVAAAPTLDGPTKEASAAPAASPAVRKLAREMDVDLASVAGSGQGGVITRDDVLSAGKKTTAHPATPPPPPVAPARASAAGISSPGVSAGGIGEALKLAGGLGVFKVPPYVARANDKVVPYTRRRRVIADHMVYSKLTSPHVVAFAECDLFKTSALRDKHKDALKKEGVNLTFLAFVAAATARALREFPVMNARVLEDSYVLLGDVNIGLAVETPEGLIVPVIRNADNLKVRGLARAIDETAKRARDNLLVPDDLAGKTFSISNPGRKGNLVGAAVISQPNVGILRIGEIKKRVVVVEQDGNDLMAIHPVMYMALSYDHRIVDGVVANGFLYRLNEILEAGDFEL